jgi:hypothetical protein
MQIATTQLVYNQLSGAIVGRMPISGNHACIRGLAVLVMIAFAASAPAAQAKAQNDADAKEIASYRLTMDAVNKLKVAMQAAAAEARKDPKYQELGRVETELQALQKKDEPSEADQARVEELSTKREELKQELEGPGLFNDASTLDEMEAAVRKQPLLSGALAKAGMPPREFAKFTFAMISASFAAGMQKSGMVKELPKDVNAENVKFILEHEAELQQLQQEFKGSDKDR